MIRLGFPWILMAAVAGAAHAGPGGLRDGTYDAYDCTARVSDERLVLKGSKMSFYESSCRLSNPQGLRGLPGPVLLDATCEGEGQTWTTRFVISQTRDGGLVVIGDVMGEKYRRCD